MNSLAILLTDHISINEKIILKSKKKLNKNNLKRIYFLGDKKKFSKVFRLEQKNKKFQFINIKNNNNFEYLKLITKEAIKLYRNKKINYLMNLPLSKKKFLKNKFPGYTEFFSYIFDKTDNENMILFNKNFSVCPITTHVKFDEVNKKISKKKIFNAVTNIINFYKKIIKKKVQIIILGVNPHASVDFKGTSIDIKITKKIVNKFKKKKINIEGPISADTAFFNTKNKLYIGMYHDQVLIPFKTLNKFNGINITIGKKLLRLSPDHGPGNNKLNYNKINTKSFEECIKFCEKY